MDSNGPHYASVIICKTLNEIFFTSHKLSPNKFKQFEDFEGKTLAISIKEPDFDIQLVFKSGIPSFVTDKLETPNTIFQTRWKEIPGLLFDGQGGSNYFIEGDNYFLEELANTLKSMKPDFLELISPITGEKNIIRLSEQIKFVITVLNSIAESTSQKTQETLSDYFANTEKLDQSINQLDQLKNRVARLNAAIRQLEK